MIDAGGGAETSSLRLDDMGQMQIYFVLLLVHIFIIL